MDLTSTTRVQINGYSDWGVRFLGAAWICYSQLLKQETLSQPLNHDDLQDVDSCYRRSCNYDLTDQLDYTTDSLVHSTVEV